MSPRRNTGIDFMEYLQFDNISRIMSLLNDPLDIIRASVVSRAWHHFVINNSLLKNLCKKNAPAISSIDSVIEQKKRASTILIDYRSHHPLSFEILKKDHIMYSYFLHALSKSSIAPKDILECVIGASSTQLYPEESIVNVLIRYYKFLWGDSYWSSKGCNDSNVPEKILFKLRGDVCIVTDIQIRPAERWDKRVYSANLVRFRMGHPKSYKDLRPNVRRLPLQEINDENYVWTHTSPEFPMLEEDSLQTYNLPEPVLCIGGYLLVELLGRAQKDEVNELYYICLGHVRIRGHSLMPAFNIQMGLSGSISLKYRPDAVEDTLDYISYDEDESEDEDIVDLLPRRDRPMSIVQIDNFIKLRMSQQ